MASRSRFFAAISVLVLGATALLVAPASAIQNPPPPTVVITHTPNLRTNAHTATFNFAGTSSDTLTYTCTLIDQPDYHQACTSGLVYDSSRLVSDGTWMFTVVATDQHGQSASKSFTWVIDTTPPVIEMTKGPADNASVAVMPVTYAWTSQPAAVNDTITFHCAYDGNGGFPPINCASPVNINTNGGTHTFTIYASDSAGNAVQLTRHYTVAPSCSLTLPSKVTIKAATTKVKAKLGSDCATHHRKSALWKVMKPTGAAAVSLAFNTAATTNTWTLPDSSKLGTYTAKPGGAKDNSNAGLYQNTTTTSVRLGSKLTLKAVPSGSHVTLTVAASTYSPSANAFKSQGNRGAVIQFRTCKTCAWQTLTSVKTHGNGSVSYASTEASARYYRAVSTSSTRVWGTSSATVKR